MEETIPVKERRNIRDRKIKALYGLGYSMGQIVEEFAQLGQNVSSATVFFAIKGRKSKEKKAEVMRKKRAIKSAINNHITKTNK